MLRTTAWILRYVQNCKTRNKTKSQLSISEINEAEKLLLRKMQQECFLEDLQELKLNRKLCPKNRLFTLDAIYKDDLIRLGGRLNNAKVNEEVKTPIILDSKHKITKLIIKYYHEKVNHHGQETVISLLRERFWIISIRKAVRSCWAECQWCKNRRASQKPPIMGQLPPCRLEPTVRPFIKTGIDYFGPISVTVKRSHEKRYGVMFTCLVTRAVHLEIAYNMSTDGFIHVLRQFACRRGYPEEIYSDNGQNFKGAEKELNENLKLLNNDPKISEFCCLKGVKWIFNPPLAPFMGGAWERLIGCVKKHLNEILKEKFPQEYVLRTAFAEIEHILNCRPLTHVSSDPDDSEALTPNHFLIGPSYAVLPCTKIEEKNMNLLSKWKAAQKLTDIFWQRWSREYLPSLICRKKWHQDHRNIKKGDVVLLNDPDRPRNIWPKGIVTEVYPAKDKRIRVVDVRTTNGSTLRRPVARLCILDVSGQCNDDK